MTSKTLRSAPSLIAITAATSALVLALPALADTRDGDRHIRLAQAMSPAPQHAQPESAPASPVLSEEDKQRIEQLKQRRLNRDGVGQPQPPPAAAAPAAPPPPAAAAPPPPPAVQPRIVNPATPPPAAAPSPATPQQAAPDGRRRERRPADTAAPTAPAPVAPPPAAQAPPPAPPTSPPPHHSTAPAQQAPPVQPVHAPRNLDDAKSGRTENAVSGGRTVIQETDRRMIIRQGDRVGIQKDEAAQLRRVAPGAAITRDAAGMNTAIVERPGNVKIITETDRSGQLMRRYRRDGSGRETQIIDNRDRKKDNLGRNIAIGAGIVAGAAILNSVVNAPPPRVRIARDKYIVRYEDASEDDVYEALSAPPVDTIERRYTLDEVRATHNLRERMRRIDLDDINFEFGSWDVNPSEYRKLERIARAMNRVIRRNPNEVFLIEGYTDAVGADVDNLTLSDRRAEAVSVILSEQFDVPFENLTTQGYGEQYLKVDTGGPERANRRVAVRRITPLIAQDVAAAEPPPPPQRPRYDRRRWDDQRYRNEDRTDRYRRWQRERRQYRDY